MAIRATRGAQLVNERVGQTCQLERLALAVAAGAIDARAARSANETLVADYDAAANRLREIDARLAQLPSPDQQLEAALRLLDEIPSIRDVPVDVARQALRDAGVRVWVEEGQIVRIEIGAVD